MLDEKECCPWQIPPKNHAIPCSDEKSITSHLLIIRCQILLIILLYIGITKTEPNILRTPSIMEKNTIIGMIMHCRLFNVFVHAYYE